MPAYGLKQLSGLIGVELTESDLDGPLPPVVEVTAMRGMQSRFALVSDLARRENLTMRQLRARLGAAADTAGSPATRIRVPETIVAGFTQGAADGFNVSAAAPLRPGGVRGARGARSCSSAACSVRSTRATLRDPTGSPGRRTG